ncbi:hypothetical protein WA538_000112 [Blastocystis sp. DL]
MEMTTGASRGELLEWINSTLHLNLTKIEETASGAVACQIIDKLFPDMVPMQKVNFAAKEPYEYTKNYKILQSAFLKQRAYISVDLQNIDVERLIKGRPQDNLEFMQWLKIFYDQHNHGDDYNPEERRAGARGGREGSSSAFSSPKASNAFSSPKAANALSSPKSSIPASTKRCQSTTVCADPNRSETDEADGKRFSPAVLGRIFGVAYHPLMQLMEENVKKRLEEAYGVIEKQKLEMSDLASERDFYNKKLASIDALLSKAKADDATTVSSLVDTIHTLLYAEVSSL